MSDRSSTVSAVLSGIVGVLVAFNTYQVSTFETDLKQVESERALNFRIYQSIAEALESDDERRMRAVRTIVEAMAGDEIKSGFLEALETRQTQLFDKETRELEVVQSSKAAPPVAAGTSAEEFDWSRWDVDVFWCATSGAAAEGEAEAIVQALRERGANGRLRARELPARVNERTSYGISGYEVRMGEGEEVPARILSELGVEIVPGAEFRRVRVAQKSPGYVSVFLCPPPLTP